MLVQARENWTAKDLKRTVEDILKVMAWRGQPRPGGDLWVVQIPPEKQSLHKPINEQRTEWAQMDEKQTLQEMGFGMKNARADEPAVLALVLPGPFMLQQ